jgi:hypothetical protein
MRVHVPQRLPVVAQPTLPLWAERRCRIAHMRHDCERADDRVRENVPRRLSGTPLQSILERRHPRRDGAVKSARPRGNTIDHYPSRILQQSAFRRLVQSPKDRGRAPFVEG